MSIKTVIEQCTQSLRTQPADFAQALHSRLERDLKKTASNPQVQEKCLAELESDSPLFIQLLEEQAAHPLLIQDFLKAYFTYKLAPTFHISLDSIQAVTLSDCLNSEQLAPSYFDRGCLALKKAAVLKVNGGLGTTMGLTGPKSLIEVFPNQHFLDIICQQLTTLNQDFAEHIPLILMNSYNTQTATANALKQYPDLPHNMFLQGIFPRIDSNTGLPFQHPDYPRSAPIHFNPPGHGNLFLSLHTSGTLKQLLDQGIETLFISNADNLGGTLDLSLLGYMHTKELEFMIEVTQKTPADVKGGTIVKQDSHYLLLERAQVADHELADFENAEQFSIFNTNNLWINLHVLQEKIENDALNLPIIANPKYVDGQDVIQLESAMGAAVSVFDRVEIVNVNRSRFLPVKKCSDLMLLQSDCYRLNAAGVPSKQQPNRANPEIQLSDEFQDIKGYKKRIQHVPSLVRAESVKLIGNISLLENVIFEGRVEVILRPGESLELKNIHVKNQRLHLDGGTLALDDI